MGLFSSKKENFSSVTKGKGKKLHQIDVEKIEFSVHTIQGPVYNLVYTGSEVTTRTIFTRNEEYPSYTSATEFFEKWLAAGAIGTLRVQNMYIPLAQIEKIVIDKKSEVLHWWPEAPKEEKVSVAKTAYRG